MIERIDEDKCRGCGLCFDSCPPDVIRMDEEKKKAVIVYREDCMTCYNCERACPEGAIWVDPFIKKQVQVWPASPRS